jgi:hypothetical protein
VHASLGDAAGDPAAVSDRLARAYGLPATAIDGRTVVVEANGSQAWSVAQWAVANAKTLDVTRVDVAGRSWDRSGRGGWKESDVADGEVRITVSPAGEAA